MVAGALGGCCLLDHSFESLARANIGAMLAAVHERRLVTALASSGVRDRRALRVVLTALLKACAPATAKCLAGHKLEPDVREGNWCDICNMTGTAYRCHADGEKVCGRDASQSPLSPSACHHVALEVRRMLQFVGRLGGATTTSA